MKLVRLLSRRLEIGALVKIEKMTRSWSSERTGVIDHALSTRWFVKMDNWLKYRADQDTDDRVKFLPHRFNVPSFNGWKNVHNWVISRQLWWGHQIPAWYNAEGEMYAGESTKKVTDGSKDRCLGCLV